MSNNTQVIESAKECALQNFALLAQRMCLDATRDIQEALRQNSETAVATARESLRILMTEGPELQAALRSHFGRYLERAMQTMYHDLRQDLKDVSFDNLSLIDDETVQQQIEVGRLANILANVDRESLGRISLMISHLHNDQEVRERENPFRLYLMARALYDAVAQRTSDEAVAAMLMQTMATSLAQQLPDYFSALRHVFESHGVEARFVAKSEPETARARTFGAAAHQASGPASWSALGAGSGLMTEDALQPLENLLSRLFAGVAMSSVGTGAVAAPWLEQLKPYQKRMAAGESLDESLTPEQNQLYVLRDKISLPDSNRLVHTTLNMVAMLVDLLLADEKIPAVVRNQIARLQIPLFKAAVLDPGLLRRHPARRLINRLCAAVSGSVDEAVMEHIYQMISRILEEFDDNLGLLEHAAQDLDLFLAQHLRQHDPAAQEWIAQVEQVHAHAQMDEALTSLAMDGRITHFIQHYWLPVLLASRDNASAQFHRDALVELVWSIQPWHEVGQRNERVRALPPLLTRLKSGLQILGLPEQQCQEALDQVVAVHFQLLRSPPETSGRLGSDRDTLRRMFVRFLPQPGNWSHFAPAPMRADFLARLEEQRIACMADEAGGISEQTDKELEALKELGLGTGIFRSVDAAEALDASVGEEPGRLIWVSHDRALYGFELTRMDRPSGYALYTARGLLKALHQHSLRFSEPAPAFDRALEDLLFGPEKIGQNFERLSMPHPPSGQ